MKKRNLLIAAVAVMLAATGCKTTENNYREAYDIAQQKRASDNDTYVVPGIKLNREDDAVVRVVDGDSVPVRVAVCNVVKGPKNRFALVTSRFKMSTNALASYNLVAEKDTTALLAQDTDEQYLVCPSSYQTMDDAAKAFNKLRAAKKPLPTPGLPDGPYILHIRFPR